jgi:hypothetical protein
MYIVCNNDISHKLPPIPASIFDRLRWEPRQTHTSHHPRQGHMAARIWQIAFFCLAAFTISDGASCQYHRQELAFFHWLFFDASQRGPSSWLFRLLDGLINNSQSVHWQRTCRAVRWHVISTGLQASRTRRYRRQGGGWSVEEAYLVLPSGNFRAKPDRVSVVGHISYFFLHTSTPTCCLAPVARVCG